MKVVSEVAGSVWKLEKQLGDSVAAGDVVMIIESMKMEIPIEAPGAGTIVALPVAQGDAVAEGQEVARLQI